MLQKLNTPACLALGCAQLGLAYGVANAHGKPSDTEGTNLLNEAYKAGIRTLDTAVLYGDSQKRIGVHLSNHPHQVWSVITKVSLGVDDLEKDLDAISLDLGRNPDAILSHNLVSTAKDEKQLEIIRQRFPKVKLGVSAYTRDDLEAALRFFQPDIVQIPLSILDRRAVESGLLELLASSQVDIHARSVFLQGAFFLTDEQFCKRFPSGAKAHSKLREIANGVRMSLSQMSLAYVLAKQDVAKVIVGAERADQLRAHLGVFNQLLLPEQIEAIDALELCEESVIDPRLWPKQ